MGVYDNQSAIVQLFHVYKSYGAYNALTDITFDVAVNEFLFISGPSGAGKTTLLKLLYMGESVSQGHIIVDGLNLSRISRSRIPFLRRKFGIIFQDYKLIPTKTAFENIALVVEAVGIRHNLIKKKVNSLLRAVNMEKKSGALPKSLSGGEQQRIAVARAVAGNPKILIADEPTGSLDSESADKIMSLLKQYHNRGATVIIATHDTEQIRKTGGRVIILKQGHLEVSTIIPKLE